MPLIVHLAFTLHICADVSGCPAIPRRWGSKRNGRICNGVSHRKWDVLNTLTATTNSTQAKRHRGVRSDSRCSEGNSLLVGCDALRLSTGNQLPIGFVCISQVCRELHGSAFIDRPWRSRDSWGTVTADKPSGETRRCPLRICIQCNPRRGAGYIRNPYFIDVAIKVIVAIPTTKPKP